MLASELITELTNAINITEDLPIFARINEKGYYIKTIQALGKEKADFILIDLASIDEKCDCPKCRAKNANTIN